MAEVAERAILNEAALKRLDPFLKKVIDYAKFVAVYTFTLKENKWEKTGIEGTLFVYSRCGEPFYNILVLNRLNMKNLVEPICSKLILQLHEPFLLYLNCKCALYGIWFYDREECTRIASLIENLVEESGGSHHNSSSGSPTLPDANICSIMSRAEQAYKDSRNNGEIESQDAKSEDEEEGAAAAAVVEEENDDDDEEDEEDDDEDDDDDEEDNTPQSVMDFFARAGCAPINAQMGLMPGMMQMDGDDSERAAMDPLIHQIISNPSHSVEHIEKQQKMASSQKRDPGRPRVMRSFVRAGGRRCQLIDPAYQDESLMELFSQIQTCNSTYQIHPIPENVIARPTQKFSLMPPSMFGPPNPKSFENYEYDDPSYAAPAAGIPSGAAAIPTIDDGDEADVDEDDCPTVSYPVTFTSGEDIDYPVDPLTKNQILQALNYLFKNDPTFIKQIHEAYVKSLGDRFP